ncbi:hypothetical protein, partial [Flavonifractor sp. An306]|uniref:hypothetical protein n=1 Tax=Flavonifractor sp. An306 TaxID=1965629 RepID=UPI0019515257
LMSRQDPPYKLVLERSATFQHYYLMEVYPPAPLTVTFILRKPRAGRLPSAALLFYIYPCEKYRKNKSHRETQTALSVAEHFVLETFGIFCE